MVKTHKKSINIPIAVGAGIVLGMMIILGCIGLLSGLILNESITENTAEIVLRAATGIAVFLGGIAGAMIRKGNNAIICYCVGGGLYAALLLMHYIAFADPLRGWVSTLLACVICSTSAILIKNMNRHKGVKKIKKYRLG